LIFLNYTKIRSFSSLLIGLLLVLFFSPLVYAATSPGLGLANTFGVLSSTYTNTAGGTTINGDLGYTTGPATAPTVNGTTHGADSTYSQAGIDQGTALANLNSQPCTFTFAAGAIDLASDATHGTVGVYTPGVYCILGAASIGGGGTITLNGSGTYIFRSTGALNTSANSIVTLSGASACDVWWTPGGATTLGANSTFFGTDIDASGITIGNAVNWTGRALAFGGTISTAGDTISVPTCSSSTSNSTSSSGSNSGSNSSTNAPGICTAGVINGTPRILASKRVSPTSIFLNWGPYQGRDTFVVEYGTKNGDWVYNTKVTGFATTLNLLPANQPIWIRVAATDNCAVGSYSDGFFAGSPSLPNTGMGPQNTFSAFYHSLVHWFQTFAV
jgi:hypothetical protein